MQRSEFWTLGSHPMIQEVRDYYLRSDILPEIFLMTQVRDVTFIYRESDSEDVHIPLQFNEPVEFENFLRQPVPNWWDVPTEAGENFQKLLDAIESDRKVFDFQKIEAKEGLNTQTLGYVGLIVLT